MTIDDHTVLTAHDKGLPVRAIGMTTSEFLQTRPRLAEFWTPLLALDAHAMAANVATMATWCAARGFSLMPHGKTTMAPTLWQQQLDAGASGITLATMGQVRTGRALGLSSIMLANAAVDPRSLAWLAAELADPDFAFVCWVDSLDTVEAMHAALAGTPLPRPINVLVELGAAGGRTGARSIADAVQIAERVADSGVLRLAGVAGYEGSLAHDRSADGVAAVRSYLESQLALHEQLRPLYDTDEIMVTAGGSAYFDIVADVWARAPRNAQTRYVLRSGAYITHDDGFYRTISPFDEAAAPGAESPRFVNALLGYARVISSPEPSLALVDGGKRDFAYDEGLPIARAWRRDGESQWQALDATVSAMNDQHSYVRGEPSLPIGAVVRLGLSHPCTAFDKWRVIPVVESAESDVVVDLVRTWF